MAEKEKKSCRLLAVGGGASLTLPRCCGVLLQQM